MTLALSCAETGRRPVVIRSAPRREPPFDDELVEPTHRPGPLDQRLPFAPVPAPGRLWMPRPRPSRLPDPQPWGRRLLIGLIEAAGGRRPLHQVAGLLSPSIAQGLGADLERAAQAGTRHWLHRASLRSIRASEPADGVAELSATIEVGPRVRAVALRLEDHRGRWRCTRLQLG